MKLEKYRTKLLFCGIMFLVAGFTVGLIGFGIGGFDMAVLEEQESPVWYRTIHLENERFWLGIEVNEKSFAMRLFG